MEEEEDKEVGGLGGVGEGGGGSSSFRLFFPIMLLDNPSNRRKSPHISEHMGYHSESGDGSSEEGVNIGWRARVGMGRGGEDQYSRRSKKTLVDVMFVTYIAIYR